MASVIKYTNFARLQTSAAEHQLSKTSDVYAQMGNTGGCVCVLCSLGEIDNVEHKVLLSEEYSEFEEEQRPKGEI